MGVVLFFQLYADMVLRTDSLTGLLNRHAYGEFLADPPLPRAVVLIDVNNFKRVSDTYGHPFGDNTATVTPSGHVQHVIRSHMWPMGLFHLPIRARPSW